MDHRYRLELPRLGADTAPAPARELLQRVKAHAGTVPNVYAAMANSPGLLATYLLGMEQFQRASGFSPAEQEAVFLAISRANGCHYCLAAHSAAAGVRAKLPRQEIDALRAGRPPSAPRLRALTEFARELMLHRGRPPQAAMERFFAAGYEERHVLELVLALALKTISNYTSHLAQPELDRMFAPYAVRAEEAVGG